MLPYLKKNYLFQLFLAVPSLLCCIWAFSVAASRGYSPAEVARLLIAVASLVVAHRLQVRGLR